MERIVCVRCGLANRIKTSSPSKEKGDVEMAWCPEMARWLSKVGTGRLEKEKTGRAKGEVMGCIGLGQ